MNDPSRQLDAAIDRLVDGEVGPEERRALLTLLEGTPDGWRRCAFAFLEAQAWREALIVSNPDAVRSKPSPILVPKRFRSLAIGTCAAAGLLLTFSIGLLVGTSGRGGVIHHEPHPALADAGHRPNAALPKSSETGVGVAEGEVASVPILDRSEIDEHWWDEAPQALPDYVRSNLERRGYQVEQRRSLVAVDLEDGRRVAVPVDQVDLRFTAPEPN